MTCFTKYSLEKIPGIGYKNSGAGSVGICSRRSRIEPRIISKTGSVFHRETAFFVRFLRQHIWDFFTKLTGHSKI